MYMKVTPSEEETNPQTIINSIKRINNTGDRIEFIVLKNQGILQYYYTNDGDIASLERELRLGYPKSYKIEKVKINPIDAIKTKKEKEIEGINWISQAKRTRDWLTPLQKYPNLVDKGNHPLNHLLNNLIGLNTPTAYQAVFEPVNFRSDLIEKRKQDLDYQMDKLGDMIINIIEKIILKNKLNQNNKNDHMAREIKELIKQKDTIAPFRLNIRAINLSGEEIHQNLSSSLYHLSGKRYKIKSKQVGTWPFRGREKQKFAKLVQKRTINKPIRDKIPGVPADTHICRRKRPDLIVGADELASFATVPSPGSVDPEVSRLSEITHATETPTRPPSDLSGY